MKWPPALVASGALQSPGSSVGPDYARLAPLIDGFCKRHVPSDAELDRLPDAIRFRPLTVAVRNAAQGNPEGWWSWFVKADELASRARELIERYR